jgi:hypothetical protein
MVDFKKIVGKKIRTVTLDKSRDLITFTFMDDSAQKYTVKGDCCSYSWVEHLEMPHPDDIYQATILSVKDSESVCTENHPEHDCLQVYHTSFVTDKGEIILEFRNSSNGYYGGYLVEA